MPYLGNRCWTEICWQIMWSKETVIVRIFHCVWSYCIKTFHLWGEEMCLVSSEVLSPFSKDGQWETKYHQPLVQLGNTNKMFSFFCCCCFWFFCWFWFHFFPQQSWVVVYDFTCCWDWISFIFVAWKQFYLIFFFSFFFLVVAVSDERTSEHVSQAQTCQNLRIFQGK